MGYCVSLLVFLAHIFKYMARDEKVKIKWEEIQNKVSEKFGGGEKMDLDAIIYLIWLIRMD